MLDPFFRSHSELVLIDDQKGLEQRDHDFAKRAIDTLVERPDLSFFSTFSCSPNPDLLKHHFEGAVWRLIKAMDPNQHFREFTNGRILCEIIFLWKMRKYLSKPEDRKSQIEHESFFVLGCMIQHKLTELLLQLTNEGALELVDYENALDANRECWITDILGAAACIRVIQAFSKLIGVRIYMPRLREDMEYGIDLLVLTQWRAISISIKSSASGPLMHAIPVLDVPVEIRFERKDEYQIFRGTKLLRRKFNQCFIPCYIRVGRPPTKLLDMTCYDSDIKVVGSLLDSVDEIKPQP